MESVGHAFPLETCTPSQLEAIDYVKDCIESNGRGLLYWLGGVRSGKSFGSTILMLEHARHRRDCKYIILGYTAPQMIEIYVPYFKKIGEMMGLDIKVSRALGNQKITIKDNNVDFLIRGADRPEKAGTIQGLTLEGMLADEVALLDRDTLHQAEARLSGDGAFRAYTSNKTSPYHWSTKYYIDRIREKAINGKLLDCVVNDNPHVNTDYVNERRKEFTGDTLTRFIDNKFTLDATPIYKVSTHFISEEDIIKQAGHKRALSFIFAHEVGYEVIQAYLLNGDMFIFRGISSARYVELSEAKIGKPDNRTVFVNCNHPTFGQWLQRSGYKTAGYLPDFKQWKLQTIQNCCADSRIMVDRNCSDLMEAIMTYSKPGYYEMPIMVAFEGMADLMVNLPNKINVT